MFGVLFVSCRCSVRGLRLLFRRILTRCGMGRVLIGMLGLNYGLSRVVILVVGSLCVVVMLGAAASVVTVVVARVLSLVVGVEICIARARVSFLV